VEMLSPIDRDHTVVPFSNTNVIMTPLTVTPRVGRVGDPVGAEEGVVVGDGVGNVVGDMVGEAVGDMVGDGVGAHVGTT